jgi:ribose-phosphate pyrophosphokinase
VLKREWYINVNISGLFAKVISRLHQKLSISSLLDNREIISRLMVDAKEPQRQHELPFSNESL